MARSLELFLLAALSAAFPAAARAADPALFQAVAREIPVPLPDKYDERAILAALLARPDAAAEFEADGRAALADLKLKVLFVAKWRGRAAAYAETQAHRPGIDYSRTYRNWKEVLGPEGHAYVRHRLLTMSKANSDKLVNYLGVLDEKLQSGGGKVDPGFFSIADKIVNGILDAYRADLRCYIEAPGTAGLRGGMQAAAGSLAAGIAAKATVAVAPKPPAKEEPKPQSKPTPKPPAKPAPQDKPQPKPEPDAPGRVEAPPPADSARGQLENAERAGEGAGGVFDGGFPGGKPSNPAVPSGGGSAQTPPGSGLSPAGPKEGGAGLAPDPDSPPEDLDARVEKARKSGSKPYGSAVKWLGGGGGALLGGLLGFLLGGPVGAAIGAAALGLGGYFLAKRF